MIVCQSACWPQIVEYACMYLETTVPRATESLTCSSVWNLERIVVGIVATNHQF